MGSFRNWALSGALVLFIPNAAALAADMPEMPVVETPVPYGFAGGWYLRGDIGWSNQQVGSLFNVLYNTTTVTNLNKGFEVGGIFGAGVGYQFSQWLRMDVTGEYRGGSTFHGLDRYRDATLPTGFGTDEYTAIKNEWLFLANAYFDLGNYRGIVPFVGAGIGASRNTIKNFTDVNTVTNGVAFANAASTWNFAWALYAGLGYEISPNATIEVAYRYVDLGDAITGDLVTYNGINNVNNPMHFKNLTSQDVKFSLRYRLN